MSSAQPPPTGPQPGFDPAGSTVPGGAGYGAQPPFPGSPNGPRPGDATYGGFAPGTSPQGGFPASPGGQFVEPHGAGASAPGSHAVSADDAGRDSGHRDVGDVSLGTLISDVTKDLSTLMRQELALAQAEIKQEVTKTAKGAGALGAAGFAGYFVLLFLSIALWSGLSNIMDAGWAGLIVALLWAVIAGVLFVMGRGQLRKVNPKPERTVDTLSQVPDALRGNAGTAPRGGHQ